MNKIKLLVTHLLIICIAVLSSAVFAFAEIGFQAKLNSPPSFLSNFEEIDDKVSVAIYPKSFPILSTWLRYKPKTQSANFEENSIRFETQYYRVNTKKYHLTPISVDAKEYSNYRIRKALQASLRENFTSSIVKVEERKRRTGLGLQVALPKRLQKIFGEGSAGLKIAGKRRISFAGRSNWSDEATSGVAQSKFPSLVMDQTFRFNITGTIGSKITVKVSQDSQTDIPLANTIQIRYKGDDDDILKSIEAGNTTLSLPNTRFVGYSSRIRGLFGLKAEAQIGSLRLVGITSQEKGSSETTSITAGGKAGVEFVRDYEYVERRIFDLILPSDNLKSSEYVSDLLMYESVLTSNRDARSTQTVANFFVNPNDTSLFASEAVIGNTTKVKLVDRDKYRFYNEPGRDLPYVVFNVPQSRNKTVGYWMEITDTANGSISTREFGDLSTTNIYFDSVTTAGDTINPRVVYSLKLLVDTDNETSPADETWKLMWRNCYSVPMNTLIEDIQFKVFKGLEGFESNEGSVPYQGSGTQTTNYLEILGLDLENNVSENPDGIVDENPLVFRPDWGLVIFPSRKPFDDDVRYTTGSNQLPELEVKIPDLYDYTSWTQKTEVSQYFIQMVTITSGTTIRLNRANIIEGSERVTANGDLLEKGVDYDIQYDFGQVTLKSEKATDPNAEIKIDFEFAPFFAVQKKSLLGLRAEYEWSKDLKFGTTFLYKSDKAQERKPKVGQETARTVIFDADIALKLHPQFLTTMIDALPLLSTEAKSNLTISAEIAQSHPNPNVNDIAYIDDFESALDNISLGTFRTTWRHTSTPAQLQDLGYVQAKMLWHRPVNQTPVTDIYKRDTQAGSGSFRTFRMIFRPQNIKYDTTFVDDTTIVLIDSTGFTKSWGGFMRSFSGLDKNRVKLFEVRLKGTKGKIHFDFGSINEDLDNDKNNDTEDQDFSDFLEVDEDGNSEEDTGLDGLHDEDEPEFDPLTNPDPNGDNWYSFFDHQGECPLPDNSCEDIDDNDIFNPIYYDYLNGTEGNVNDGSSRLPDKEQISQSFTTENTYFSFLIDLDNAPDTFLVKDSRIYPENPINATDTVPWVTYRIPIRVTSNIDQIVTSNANKQPEWDQIKHIRVWMEGDENSVTPDTIEIADWYFVQPSWKDTVIVSPLSDQRTKFVISAISDDVDENFIPPPNIETYTDPTTNVVEVQKALRLTFTDMDHNDTCMAIKNLFSIDQYSGYRRLEMYVHGEEGNPTIDKVKFFFRLGKDDQNYYEFFTNIESGWATSNYVNIDFNELTALKDSGLKEIEFGEVLNVSNDKFRIFGRPNINEIKFLAVGVLNEDPTQPISGDIWVDELRVTDVRKDVGSAGRISANGNMADFLTYNFSLQSKDPFFRGLSAATRGGSQNNLGSGRHETSLSSSVTFQLHKLLPRSLNASIPVSLTYSKSVQTPLLRNNSDIVLPEDVRLLEQRISETKSITVSARFNNKTKNPLFSVLLNRLNTRVSYRQSNLKSVNFPFNYGEVIDIKADYDLNIKNYPKVPIFFFLKSIPILKKMSNSKLSLYPDSWSMNGSFNRSLTVIDDVNFNRRSTMKRTFVGSMRLNYKIFDNLVSSFNYDTRRDLADLDDINFSLNKKEFKLGIETHYGQRFSLSYDPKLLSFFTSSASFKSSYSDDWERGNSSRRSALTRNISVGGSFDHQALLGGKPKVTNRGFKSSRRGGRRKNVLEEENKPKTKFYTPVFKGIRKLTGWINPIKYSYSTNYKNSLPGLTNRPGYKYLFGFKDNTDVETIVDTRTQISGEGDSYDLSSGFTFLSGIVTTIKYRRSSTRDLVKQGKRNENISVNWPDLSIRINKFRHLPLIQTYVNKFIDIFSPKTGFSRSVRETMDIDGGFTVNKTTNISFSPLLQVNFKLFRSLSLTSSVTRSIAESETHSPLDGALQNTSTTTKETFVLSTKYSFTSPHGISIPILGKLKFKSTVDLSMNVKFNSSKTENNNEIGADNVTNDETSLSFNPVIAYTFSRQIRGGITMRWQDSSGRRNSHTREVQLWTEISF